MKKNIDANNTFCFVEENNNIVFIYRLLSRVLNLNSVQPNSNCVIICSNKAKKIIKNFPITYTIKLHFIKNKFKKYGLAYTYFNIFNVLKYAIEQFGSGIYMYDAVYILRKISIPESLKSQGFGYHKKIYNSHIEEDNKKRYTFELTYANNIEFIRNIESLLEIDDLTCIQNDEDIEKVAPQLKNIEYDFFEKYDVQYFFEPETMISTEDFLSFNNSVDVNDITQDFKYKEKNITFLNLRLNHVNTQGRELNKKLLLKLIKYNKCFFNLINLTNITKKVHFIKPMKNIFGLWNRESENPGLYEIIDFFEEKYKDYCTSMEFNYDYFSVNSMGMFDKTSDIYLTKELTIYKRIFLNNYDSSVIHELDKYNINYQFLFYFFQKPKLLEGYYLQNKKELLSNERTIESCSLRQVNNDSYTIDDTIYTEEEMFETLMNVKYVYLDKFNANLMTLCFGLGCVPIFKSLDIKPLDIELDKHYHFVTINKKINYTTMKKNVLSYYQKKISLSQIFKNLVNHLFVWDVE